MIGKKTDDRRATTIWFSEICKLFQWNLVFPSRVSTFDKHLNFIYFPFHTRLVVLYNHRESELGDLARFDMKENNNELMLIIRLSTEWKGDTSSKRASSKASKESDRVHMKDYTNNIDRTWDEEDGEWREKNGQTWRTTRWRWIEASEENDNSKESNEISSSFCLLISSQPASSVCFFHYNSILDCLMMLMMLKSSTRKGEISVYSILGINWISSFDICASVSQHCDVKNRSFWFGDVKASPVTSVEE